MTDAQFKVLDNLDLGLEPLQHVRGRAAYGGSVNTIGVLLKRRWIDREWAMTDAGRAAHHAEQRKREGRVIDAAEAEQYARLAD